MGAVDFLFTPGMQRVLSALYASPDRSFTLNDLLEKAGNGKGSTQGQIERLIAAGVIVEEARRGRQRSLRANTGYFLYPELKAIAAKTFGVAEPLTEALAPFATEISEAFVFGSVANQTDSFGSDIDLTVIGNLSLLALTEHLLDTERLLGRSIHLNLYSTEEWAHLQSVDPIISQISRNARLQLISNAATTRV